MLNDSEKFEIVVWGGIDRNEFLKSRWDVTDDITHEAAEYLKSLGYNAIEGKVAPGFGATAGIWGILMSLHNLIPLMKTMVFVFRVLSDKYSRYALNWAGKNRPSMFIATSHKANDEGWINSWDPAHASKKLDSLLDASHFVCNYLKSKYPNIIFTQTVEVMFNIGESSQSYSFNMGEDTDINMFRYKKIFRQTTFEKFVSKDFSIHKKLFIKRVDFNKRNFSREILKTYYFLIPSILLKELRYKHEVLSQKLSEGGE